MVANQGAQPKQPPHNCRLKIRKTDPVFCGWRTLCFKRLPGLAPSR